MVLSFAYSVDMTTTYETDVEVELHELLDWGRQYEGFCDLLRDKVSDFVESGGAEEALAALDEHARDDEIVTLILTDEYRITGNPRPNVVMFSVTWHWDT